ncbi:hypothetical protein [Thermomonospora echinospora]|uniref:hypothetical protein n=1 Tax=Thermomonospora echinospora TaxID=1992 RepID=UPI0011B05B74|nr:hypothetical protein [Thermomonospora echinospora]
MDLPWSLIVTTVGAVLTTLLGVLVGGAVTSRSQRRHWSRDRQMEACAQVLRESSNVLIELAAANGQRINPDLVRMERPMAGLPTLIDWRPWNEALAMVNLVADHDIVEAAHAIDMEMWPVHLKIKAGMTREGDWFGLRDKIESRRRDFVNVARGRLASAGPPLRRLTGRPTPDDPVWELRRPPLPHSDHHEQSAS